jgi:hypothetical protein
MAYTPLNIGYSPTASNSYAGTTDSPIDWVNVPSETLFFDLQEQQVFYKDVNNVVYPYKQQATEIKNVSSTQWNKTLPAPVTLNNGDTANGFTFFDNVLDKTAGGTTSYDEYNIAYGISIILDVANTNGTANINILGTDYLITFDTDNFTSVSNWLATNEATLNALNVRVFRLGSGTDGRLRFCSTEAILNGITFTNLTGDIAATIQNEFTGSPTASGDHLLIPYTGRPYENNRILHTIRANFNLTTGSVQYAELGLFRYANDSLIGSSIPIVRNNDVTGAQVVLETYTASATDSFVLGGFYVALTNNTGVVLEFINNAGVLIQNIYDSPVSFTE